MDNDIEDEEPTETLMVNEISKAQTEPDMGTAGFVATDGPIAGEIGRASCRERV